MFGVAQRSFEIGDLIQARAWFRKALGFIKTELAAEETFVALWRMAEIRAQLGEPWPTVRNAFLESWAFRPTRAEPLYAIAQQSRARQLFHQAYLFAILAVQIPRPDDDTVSVATDVYTWRATDEQATCAALIGRSDEALNLWAELLQRDDIPDTERSRIVAARANVAAARTAPSSP